MANVYIEPRPKGRPEGSAIEDYVLEYQHGDRVTDTDYSTQADAISAARNLGHRPLVARVRNTDKGNPDHWREAYLLWNGGWQSSHIPDRHFELTAIRLACQYRPSFGSGGSHRRRFSKLSLQTFREAAFFSVLNVRTQ
jgi:hypothetical protein